MKRLLSLFSLLILPVGLAVAYVPGRGPLIPWAHVGPAATSHSVEDDVNRSALLISFLFGAFCALWAQNSGRFTALWFFAGFFFNAVAILIVLYLNYWRLEGGEALTSSSKSEGPASRSGERPDSSP